MTTIEIEYCVPCGLLARAEEVEHALLSRLGQRLGGVLMRPGAGGVFTVSVDGEPVFEKGRDSYDLEEIVARAERRVDDVAQAITD
jgi:selenoprotein W-related protein